MSLFATDGAVLVSGVLFLALLAFIAAYRPVLLFAFLFILFTLAWRTAATMYIDLAGPVYSSQTLRYIGPGAATPIHVLAYTLTVLPFLLVLRKDLVARWVRSADTRPSSESLTTLSDFTYVVSAVFMGWLFFDLTQRGVVPFFDKLERYVYTEDFAGAAHRWLIRYGYFLCFLWGMMFAAEKIRNARFDVRILTLLFVLFVYLLLTGNRFSAFYGFGSFFALPFAAAIAVKEPSQANWLPFSWFRRSFGLWGSRAMASLLVVTGLAIGAGLFNSLTNVRGYAGAAVWSHFAERMLIQPSEMGWISYERTFLLGHWDSGQAFDSLFRNPIDAVRNTTPQFLMLETIGEPRTSDHVLTGFQFAGGFPEIFFELFGPYLAWPFILGGGWIAAALTALFVRGVIQGRYVTAFFALYALFGFYIMYISGMLNFVLVWTYWAKLTALGIAIFMERSLSRHGLSLAPWVVARAFFWQGALDQLRMRLGTFMGRAQRLAPLQGSHAS